jgi:hypothetical protein
MYAWSTATQPTACAMCDAYLAGIKNMLYGMY